MFCLLVEFVSLCFVCEIFIIYFSFVVFVLFFLSLYYFYFCVCINCVLFQKFVFLLAQASHHFISMRLIFLYFFLDFILLKFF